MAGSRWDSTRVLVNLLPPEVKDRHDSYNRILGALAGGDGEGATEVRNRLLEAIARHTGGTPPEDDRTLVVMRWGGGGS